VFWRAAFVLVFLIWGPTVASALVFLSPPGFVPSTNAPLAGVLHVNTDLPSRVSVSVADGAGVWTRNFFDYGTNHSEPLYGFKPGRTNLITVTVLDQQHRPTASAPLTFVTAPLPAEFPAITLKQSQPALMEPGYTLFMVQVHSGVYAWGVILDPSANVVWYGVIPSTLDVRQLANGDLFMPWTNRFNEINLLGQVVNTWTTPPNLLINEHDGVPTDHGTILYLSDATELVTNYPTSMTLSNAPHANENIVYQKVIEISATNSALLNLWTPINVLDPRRISYLITPITGGWDAEHSNAVIEDPSDDSLIVSMRHQNAIVKFSRATGQLIWILGTPDNWGPQWQPYLLQPVGTPFFWEWAQHSPVFTPQGTLMVYDDGNYRASPFATSLPDAQNYSRAVEYSINEQTMQVTQVWDYGRTNVAERLYTNHEGNAEPEPVTGNVLIDFANVNYDNGTPPSTYGANATLVRLTEVTHQAVPQIVFDVELSMYSVAGNSGSGLIYEDCSVYRAHRITDLYAHPALPVGDLTVSWATGIPVLGFTGDDFRSYLLESSFDLVNWTTLGAAVETAPGSDFFRFQDLEGSGTGAFYRVVTQ